MTAAHYLSEYKVRNLHASTRPYVCGLEDASSKELCHTLEDVYMQFMRRSLFAVHYVESGKDGKKGRAADAENKRSEFCLKEALNATGKTLVNRGKTLESTSVGTTTELMPNCAIKDFSEPAVLPEASPKPAYHISANWIADHYRRCGMPFVAGVSGSIQQYWLMAAGGKEKVANGEHLSDKELLALASMLELAGFHSFTELIMGINHYHANVRVSDVETGYKGMVKPPFDSGDLLTPDFGQMRCNEQQCCGNFSERMSQKDLLGDDSPYMKFYQRLEAWVDKTFQNAAVPTPPPTPAPTSFLSPAPTPAPTSSTIPRLASSFLYLALQLLLI
jgi:hypothetical protein